MKLEEIQKEIDLAKMVGFDFNGTIDTGVFKVPKGSVVITGGTTKEEDYVNKYIKDNYDGLISGIYFNDGFTTPRAIGEFKALKIKELGIDLYVDNDPVHVYWIKKFNPTAGVLYIHRPEYLR